MKVILTQDVRGQGKRGQMIDVSDGYARNFLLPRKLAQEATADNINTMRMNDKATQERQAKERAEFSWTSGKSFWMSRSRLLVFIPSSASLATRSTQNSRLRSKKVKTICLSFSGRM